MAQKEVASYRHEQTEMKNKSHRYRQKEKGNSTLFLQAIRYKGKMSI